MATRGGVDVEGAQVEGRAAWGADEALGGREAHGSMVPRALVIHHSHTPDDLGPEETMRWLQRLHVVEKGWDDLGYHLGVGPDGRIYQGRRTSDPLGASGEVVVGAHAYGANFASVGIVVLGDFHDHLPTPEARAALVDLCTDLCARHGIDPAGAPVRLGPRVTAAPLAGHRDARPPDMRRIRCPGAVFDALLPALVGEVAAQLTARST